MADAWPWGLVIIGGPIVIGLVLFWAQARSRKAEAEIDPDTPADDPSKGM